MKIAIQNKVIDTNDIYCIHEIDIPYGSSESWKSMKFKELPEDIQKALVNGSNTINFDIEFFNNKELTVSLEKFSQVENNKLGEGETLYDVFLRNIERLEKMRNDIIKIWSDNQSNIPTFNLNNY